MEISSSSFESQRNSASCSVRRRGDVSQRQYSVGCATSPRPPAQYVTTVRGHRLIIYKDYTYCLQHSAASTEKWKCVSRTAKKCKAKIVVDASGNVLRGELSHDHPPPNASAMKMFRRKVAARRKWAAEILAYRSCSGMGGYGGLNP
uniref:SFRICE_000695 n=1 Tax=Spodoptera frugiperda TaxID=7108 RepID=A0A2H1V095_SPOFR